MQLVTEDNITDLAVERWATAHDPRTAELMTALVRHLHDFAREVRLTEAEWMAAIQWLNRAGRITVGASWADGRGRLAGNSGAGRWSGIITGDQCSGVWQASRG